MTKTSEAGESGEIHSKEWLDEVVVNAFEELLIEIASDPKLHPSEQINKVKVLAEFSNVKIYEFINAYHAYCKLCEQHFYSRTLASDINSFFQKHLNTAYHRQIRAVCPPSDTTPIFTWETKLQSARCNLCEMSNITPYIIDTDFDIKKLIKLHVCFWDYNNRDTNEKVLKKFNLLKKYCRLNIFREKFIKTVKNSTVCLLCMTKLPWSGEKAYCHLGSDTHYHKFCALIRAQFNFLPKDVLNGFNLETITRSLISRDLPIDEKFSDFNERKICLEESNDVENPYSELRDNYSFSAKLIDTLLLEENDFIHNNKCLLCNKAFEPGHLNSKLHQSKAKSIQKMSPDAPEIHSVFLRYQERRMRMIEKYQRLKTGVDNPPLPVTQNNADKGSPDNYFKTLCKMKMDLVKAVFKQTSGEIFCQVCDQFVSSESEISHLNNPHHKEQEERWKELQVYFKNERFFETFVRIKNVITCLVCGCFFDPSSFFSHLKGGTHLRKFEWYCNHKNETPISSAFKFNKDYTCCCTVCGTPMNKRASFFSLKATLKQILCHWPCPSKTEKKTDVSKELTKIFKTNETVVQKNLNLVREMAVPCSTCGRPFKETEMKEHSEACAKNSVDFKKVEKTVGNFMNVFERKIMDNVLDKTAVLLCSLNNLSITPTTNEIKKGLDEEEPSEDVEDPVKEDSQSSLEEQTSEKPVEEKRIKILKNESRQQKTENNVNQKVQVVNNIEKINLEKEHEVLVIEGLPKKERRYDNIYDKFNKFGKVRYVFFTSKKTLVAFENCNTAEIAAKTPDLFENIPISLSIISREDETNPDCFKFSKKPRLAFLDEKAPVLERTLVPLLKDPSVLMDFSLDLIKQAISATESPVERKREELVCATIISAVLQTYPLSRCYPFGSRLSGLTLNNSDLDVFLDCGGMYEGYKNTSPSCQRKLVNRVAGLLKKKEEITQMNVVDRARVPIVSFLHKPTNMRCDLSFRNGLSVQNTLLIKFMISLDWRVRPLILFLKHWAKMNGLHGPPYFSSYAIAMMVIFYLEQLECPVLPTIESLQNSYTGRRMTIGGWDCSINFNKSTIPKSENNTPFLMLLADLFEFYATFEYGKNVISPLTGKIFSREAFSAKGIKTLPLCYKRNILNLPTPIETLVNKKIQICIIDPFDLSHVLTKSFTLRGLSVFIHLCRISARLLKNAIVDGTTLEEQ